jgi:hypothetical protein
MTIGWIGRLQRERKDVLNKVTFVANMLHQKIDEWLQPGFATGLILGIKHNGL